MFTENNLQIHQNTQGFEFSTRTAEAAPHSSRLNDPFEIRFGHRLPRGLRAEAHGMSWRTFTETFAPQTELRLTNIHEEELLGGKKRFYALIHDSRDSRRIAIGREAIAFGAVAACTQLLWDMGKPVEILNFHQCEIFEATATFIYAGHGRDEAWAVGFGQDSNNSIAAAMSSAAGRIHG